MRKTITISVSPTLKKEIDDMVESGIYTSTSELVRDAVRTLKDKKIIAELRISQAEAQRGKITLLQSLKDLE